MMIFVLQEFLEFIHLNVCTTAPLQGRVPPSWIDRRLRMVTDSLAVVLSAS